MNQIDGSVQVNQTEDPHTLFRIGMHFLKNESNVIRKHGIELLSLAAEKGSTEAMFHLGKHYIKGDLVPRDKKKGIIWLQKAAEKNHILAMRTLAYHLYRARRRRRSNSKAQKRKKADNLLRKAAALGSIEAMEELGSRLSQPFRPQEDFKEGKQWKVKAKKAKLARQKKRQAEDKKTLKKFAEDQDANAMFRYGERLLSGVYGKENRSLGIDWLEKAANAGSVEAMVSLGQRLIKGKGIQRNVQSGIDWLKQASKYHHLSAIQTLGRIYLFGEGVQKDHRQAISWLEKAANLGSTRDMIKLGELLKSDLQQRKALLEKAAQLKDTSAMIKLGQYFIEGPKSQRDKDLGMKWLKCAERNGSTAAKWMIGQYLVNGKIPNQHPIDGIEYLEQAATHGSVQAMIKLSKVYQELVPNHKESENWRTQAMKQRPDLVKRKLDDWRRHFNHKQSKREKQRYIHWENLANEPNRIAMIHLGMLLLEGQGVTKNRKLGIEWLKQAAELGSKLAMFKLGEIYVDGYMVNRNRELGIEWLKQAAELGSKLALFKLGEINVKDQKNKQKLREWYEQVAMEQFGLANLKLEKIDPQAAKIIRLIHQKNKFAWEEPVVAYGNKLVKQGDHKRAIFYLKQAANRGSMKAMSVLGKILFGKNQQKEGLAWIKKAAELGSIEAMSYLVKHFQKREQWGIKDTDMLQYLKKTAENKDFNGLLYLGIVLITGSLGVSDVQSGMRYLKQSAELNMNQTKKLLDQEHHEKLKNLLNRYEWIGILAQNGDIPSMIRFGKSLISKNLFDQGKYWFQQAIRLGSTEAMLEWGKLLLPKDEFEGLKWIREAATRGSKKAQAQIKYLLTSGENRGYNYSKKYLDKESLEQCNVLLKSVYKKTDLYETFKQWLVQKKEFEIPDQELYKHMMEKSQSQAKEKPELSEVNEVNELQYRLTEQELLKLQKWSNRVLDPSSAEVSTTQFTVDPQDIEESVDKEADDQFISAILPYAKTLLDEEDWQKRKEGKKWIEYAAKQGDLDAMMMLATRYIEGDVFKYDAEKAKYWLIRAGEAGRKDAWWRLGKELLHGEKVPKNIEEGRKWLAKAANSGVTQAAYLLGNHYLEAEEYAEAMKWMKTGANQGNLSAMKQLGETLIKGNLCNRNLLVGRRWLEKGKRKQYRNCVPLKDKSVKNIEHLLSVVYQFNPSKKRVTAWDVVMNRLTQPYKLNFFKYLFGGFPYYRKDEITSLWYQHKIKKVTSLDKFFFHQPFVIQVTKHAMERWNQRVGPILTSRELHYLIRFLYYAGRIDFYRSRIAVIDNEIVLAFERTKKQITIKTFLGRISLYPEFANYEELQSKMIFYQRKTSLKVSKKTLEQYPIPVVPREIFHLESQRGVRYVLSEYEYWEDGRLTTVIYFYEVNKNPIWKKIAYDDLYQPGDTPLDPSILRLLYLKGYEKYVLSYLAYHEPDQVVAILKEIESSL